MHFWSIGNFFIERQCSFVGLGFCCYYFLLCKALLDHWELALYKYCILLLLLLLLVLLLLCTAN